MNYHQWRDFKAGLTHGSSTDRGDTVVVEWGEVEAEEKRTGEGKALAVAQEVRAKSVRKAVQVFESWKSVSAVMMEGLRLLSTRTAFRAAFGVWIHLSSGTLGAEDVSRYLVQCIGQFCGCI